MAKEHLILVNEQDEEVGQAEKLKAHKEGVLHRSFSIFVFNAKGELLLQRRAAGKYHSGGLWTNACCGHPRPGESTEQAAHRRLQEEMGFDCELKELLQFTYKVKLNNDLWEHEYDHVFGGIYEGEVHPDPAEAEDYDWVDKETLSEEMRNHPDQYTPWFKIALPRVYSAGN